MAEPAHPLGVRPWVARVRADMSPESAGLLASYAPLWARRRCRLLMPLALPLGQTLDQELTRLEALPLDRFVEVAADAVHGGLVDVGDLLADETRRAAYVA